MVEISRIIFTACRTQKFSQVENGRRLSAARNLAIAAIMTLGFGAAAIQSAQAAYPERPLRILVGFTPGGSVDTIARLIGTQLSEKLGQSVIVENRAGANATIAAEVVARAAPDGYTLLMNSQAHTLAPGTMKLSYDAIKDFAPITLVARVPNLLVVNPKLLAVNNTREFIALARSKPGELNFGHAGTGDPTFMTMALMMKQAGITMTNVPYKGIADAQTALLGGQIHAVFGSILTLQGQIKAGALKALAISSKTRVASLPDVPSVAESGGLPNYDVAVWYGMLTTAGTPTDVLNLLHRRIVEIANGPELSKTFIERGFDKELSKSPDDFAQFIKRDFDDIGSVLGIVKAAN
ncbi:MAG: tripartite tricarboxylate transporter substrate binding protein [Burkholderiales bacterium]